MTSSLRPPGIQRLSFWNHTFLTQRIQIVTLSDYGVGVKVTLSLLEGRHATGRQAGTAKGAASPSPAPGRARPSTGRRVRGLLAGAARRGDQRPKSLWTTAVDLDRSDTCICRSTSDRIGPALAQGERFDGPGTDVLTRPRARVRLPRQESALPLHRRARDVFAEHVAGLVTAGLLAESEAVGLSSLGLPSSADAGKRVGELSMGQRRRLDLACALAARPHALLLDEPTNHLSIALVDELTEALRATAAAVVVATHDRQTLRDLADWPRLETAAEPRRQAAAET